MKISHDLRDQINNLSSDDDHTFGASAIINVEADSILQVESETQAEADVEGETNGQVKIGARAWGGNLHSLTGEINDKVTASPTTHAAPTTQQPTTRTVHTHVHPNTPHTHAPYVCDNGGTWNHGLQRCDCPTGFGGKTRIFRDENEKFEQKLNKF